jgi:hypothetical protein
MSDSCQFILTCSMAKKFKLVDKEARIQGDSEISLEKNVEYP